jgi:plasmid maintenance system antidote protein VapI
MVTMQQQYDLWQARKAVKLGKVRRLVEQRKAVGGIERPETA